MVQYMSAFDVFVACFNAAVGAGFLAIPYVFLQLGVGPCVIMLIVFTFVSTISWTNLTEAGARMESVIRMDADKVPRLGNFRQKKETLLGHELKLYGKEVHYEPEISDSPIELADMVEILYGSAGKITFNVLLFIETGCSLAAIACVFAASFARNVPIGPLETCDVYESTEIFDSCKLKYIFWLTIYIAWAMFMTALGPRDQKSIQMISTALRFIIIGLMLITAIISIAADEPLREVVNPDEQAEFNFKKLGINLSIMAFAASYSVLIPGVNCFLKDKSPAVQIQFWVNMAIAGLVLAVGICVSVALRGTNAPSQTSLAWNGYDAGFGYRVWWMYIIEYSIILFPAFNVLSSGPLMGYGAAGNFVVMFKNPGRITAACVRAGVWVIPYLLCCWTYDLAFLSALTGVPCFITYYGACSVCHLQSMKIVKLPCNHSGWWSWPIWSWLNIIIVLFASVITIMFISEF